MNKHAIDNASTGTLLSCDIMCLTEIQLEPNQNTVNIENALSNFSVIFNSSERKFKSLAFCHAQSVENLNCISMEGISIFTIRKRTFREDSITIALESAISPAIYLNELSQVISNVNVDIILGDFNIGAFGQQRAIIEDKLHMYDMVINKPTHLSGSLLDQVHILKSFAMEFNIVSDVHNVYFSDHDTVKVHFQ